MVVVTKSFKLLLVYISFDQIYLQTRPVDRIVGGIESIVTVVKIDKNNISTISIDPTIEGEST